MKTLNPKPWNLKPVPRKSDSKSFFPTLAAMRLSEHLKRRNSRGVSRVPICPGAHQGRGDFAKLVKVDFPANSPREGAMKGRISGSVGHAHTLRPFAYRTHTCDGLVAPGNDGQVEDGLSLAR